MDMHIFPLDDRAGTTEIQPSRYGEKQRAYSEHGPPLRRESRPIRSRRRSRRGLHYRLDEDFRQDHEQHREGQRRARLYVVSAGACGAQIPYERRLGYRETGVRQDDPAQRGGLQLSPEHQGEWYLRCSQLGLPALRQRHPPSLSSTAPSPS